MKMKLYNDLNFSGYKSSKYSYPETKNSILDKPQTHNISDNLDLSDFQSLYDYSNEKIGNLYKYYVNSDINAQYGKECADKIIKKLEIGDVEASYTEMLLELVEEEKISPYVLDDITGRLNSNAVKDIDKLYEAYADNKNIKDVFVPYFEDKKEAEKSLETGDICRIGDNKNISIKLQDGSFKTLFITPETYLELFPPVERFIITQSGRLGDCYLLSSIDSINQNPNTRYKLLEMFKENEDGTVDAALSGFKNEGGQIVQADPSKTIIKDISKEILKVKDDKITSFTTEGVRAVEILYEKMEQDKSNAVIEERHKLFKDLKHAEGKDRFALNENDIFWSLFCDNEIREKQKELEDTDSIMISGLFGWKTITKEEMDYFCTLFENGEEMFVVGDTWKRFELSKEEVYKKLSEIQARDDDFSKYETLVLKRLINEFKDSSKPVEFYEEILPKRLFYDVFDNITKFDLMDSTSGFEKDALENLGLIDTVKKLSDSDFIKEKLFTPDVSKYVFTCASKQSNPGAKIPLYNNHAYSLSPVDTNDGRKFLVRDPHNTLNEVILSYEEICGYFDTVDYGRLP